MHDAAATREPSEVLLRRANLLDLDDIAAIERESFTTPWSRPLLASELAQDDNVYLVVSLGGRIVGFLGMWHVLDEAHIATLAVDPDFRGMGLGELLVLAALRTASELGADCVHLEYRVGNALAAALYEKLGFKRVGRRQRYYTDTGEDAILARIDGLTAEEGVTALREAWDRWLQERGFRVVCR